MFSKAEILYLQGQKHISRSYERKLRCLIRKKLDVLQKELPLLSKLLKNEVRSFADISSTELAAPTPKVKRSYNESNQSLTPNNRATKFSNIESKDIEDDVRKIVKSQNFDEPAQSVKGNSIPATEFSNEECDGATKFSNSHEIHDIELNRINISLNGASEQRNFKILNEVRLLSYMGRVGCSSKLGIIQVNKEYENQVILLYPKPVLFY